MVENGQRESNQRIGRTRAWPDAPAPSLLTRAPARQSQRPDAPLAWPDAPARGVWSLPVRSYSTVLTTGRAWSVITRCAQHLVHSAQLYARHRDLTWLKNNDFLVSGPVVPTASGQGPRPAPSLRWLTGLVQGESGHPDARVRSLLSPPFPFSNISTASPWLPTY
jgi:hypothetical protein